MTEDRFWEIIGNLNYGKDLDDGRVGADLIAEKFCSINESRETDEMVGIFYNRLENAMDEQLEDKDLDYDEYIGLGDDGLSDLLSHVVGLGKDEYYKCLNDVKELSKHALGEFGTVDGYTESFLYSFHVLMEE